MKFKNYQLPIRKEKVKMIMNIMISCKDDSKNKEKTQISFTKNVLIYVILLTCILTLKN